MKAHCSQIDPIESTLLKEINILRFNILREPLGLSFEEDELLNEIKDNYYIIIGDMQSKTLIGTLLLKKVQDPTELKMRQVAIRSDLQRMGFGKQLVEFAEEFAKSKGIKRLILHARKTALPFYLKLGYLYKNECFEEVGIEHYFMWKDL